ncbi:MAG TPA: helix-turn-helix domain-containing protein [Bacteroidota bacterium]|nr:helix-turn-helix domain-containing protein [Bacteroidota bacterium]
MTEILFNTMDVSKMLQVDKSTVKRWTDEGKLKCFRTPGGHRKFRAEDLYQFMSDYNYGISPINLYPQFASDEAIIRRIITRKEFNVLTNVCFSASINGRKDELVKLFSEVYKNGLTLPVLFDEIVRPTIKRISDLNISGKLSAAEMQLAFNALSNGVVLLSDIIVKPTPNGRKAICATLTAEPHDIELKALATLLESEGYEVLNLGVAASTETIEQLMLSKRPQHVFVCAFHHAGTDSFQSKLSTVIASASALAVKVIVGGYDAAQGLANADGQSSADRHCTTFREFANVQHEPASQSGPAAEKKDFDTK